MPRPDTVTDADFARWREEIRQAILIESDTRAIEILQMCMESEDRCERAYYTGAWLGERLAELDCPQDIRSRICFAHGQRAMSKRDPWELAQEAISEWRQGRWEEPGPELAERIFRETFPEIARRRREAP